MDPAACKICYCNFSEILKPKILECGHSFCERCLSKLIRRDATCPQCRKKLSKTSILRYPINFGLLHMIQSVDTIYTNKENFKSRFVFPMKKRLNEMKKRVTERMDSLKREANEISNEISALEKIERAKTDDLDIKSSMKVLNMLKKKLNDNNKGISSLQSEKIFQIEPNLHLKNFENMHEFLIQVYKKIEIGEKMYVYQNLYGECKIGIMEIFGNKILIYSLSKHTEELEISSTDTIVSFKDLKKCMISSKVYAFIKICCSQEGLKEMFVIEMTNHPLVPQFLKLCTGETGPTYKGSDYRTTNLGKPNLKTVFDVEKYKDGDVNREGQIDFISKFDVSTMCKIGQLYVGGFENGQFHVVKISDYEKSYGNIIGKVILPFEIQEIEDSDEHFSYMKIIDCGIMIPVSRNLG